MEIEIGKYYVNKTWKYLRPCLKEYGPTFVIKFNALFKLAMGIHDCVLDGTDFENQRLIYMLLDKKYNPRAYESFMNWARHQSFYVTDYSHDVTLDGRRQMVVVKVPKKFEDAYDQFINSRYSRMYLPEEIEHLFEGEGSKKVKEILLQYDSARREFVDKVNKTFNTAMRIEDTYGGELDFPIEKQKEYFNHGGG